MFGRRIFPAFFCAECDKRNICSIFCQYDIFYHIEMAFKFGGVMPFGHISCVGPAEIENKTP